VVDRINSPDSNDLAIIRQMGDVQKALPQLGVPGPGPVRASQLRVALLTGERLSESMRGSCTSLYVPKDLSDSWLRKAQPHLLLAEADAKGIHGIDQEALTRITGSFAAAQIPSALWVTEGGGAAILAGILESFDHVFAGDPRIAESLMAATATRPIVLPHAAAAGGVQGGPARGEGVAYVGGYPKRWALRTRELADAVLKASMPLGLRILIRTEEEIESLPLKFRPFVRWAKTPADLTADLRESRVLVDFEPEVPLPATIFDGLATGLLVIAPRNYTVMRVLPRLVSYPGTPEDAVKRIAWSSERGLEQNDLAQAGRAGVLHAHTYSHRIATIASAFGVQVMPDPPVPTHQ